MIYGLYAVYDSISKFYAAPFIASGDDEAMRMFKCDYDRSLKDASSSPFSMFIGDFNLYKIGTYDSGIGSLDSSDIPILVLSGRSLLPADV